MTKPKRLNFNDPAPDLTLLDLDGQPVQLSSLWRESPLLLAFTRHFGCTQCKEMLDQISGALERIEAAGLRVVVVSHASPEATRAFMARQAPRLLALADPDRSAYRAYGLGRANLFQTFLNLRVIRAVSRSRRTKGYRVEPPPKGQDSMQESGAFIISRQGTIELPYYYDHIADHPTLDLLLNGVLATNWGATFDGPIGPSINQRSTQQ